MKTKVFAVVFAVLCLLYAFHSMAKADGYKTTPAGLPEISVVGERDGYLFLSVFDFSACSKDNYALILDGKGDLVYYKRIPDCDMLADFRTQPDGSLSYWQGKAALPGIFHGQIIRMNDQYSVTQVITTNDYMVDNHEFLTFPDGGYMFMYHEVRGVTGVQQGTIPLPNAMVTPIIVGFDKHGLETFRWDAYKYIGIYETTDSFLAQDPSDYVHANALEIDTDGNILLSSRHTNEITKIDRTTGDVIWRLGGKANEFDLIGDGSWFTHQHDVRRLPNGNISIFDNGNLRSPPYSRYVEYAVDEENYEVRQVKEISHTTGLYSWAMGSARVLPNGHTLIGWGAYSAPAVTEYDGDANPVFEMSLPDGKYSYRAYSDDWEGQPTIKPTAIITDGHLFYSWNGATDVSGYKVYAGIGNADRLITSQAKTGFEDSTPLVPGLCMYRVDVINRSGGIAASSANVVDPACTRLFFPVVRP